MSRTIDQADVLASPTGNERIPLSGNGIAQAITIELLRAYFGMYFQSASDMPNYVRFSDLVKTNTAIVNIDNSTIVNLLSEYARKEDVNNLVHSTDSQLITYNEYRNAVKTQRMYFVAKDAEGKARQKCWRIYYRTQLIGEFDLDNSVTLPRFPMRFPFRFS